MHGNGIQFITLDMLLKCLVVAGTRIVCVKYRLKMQVEHQVIHAANDETIKLITYYLFIVFARETTRLGCRN